MSRIKISNLPEISSLMDNDITIISKVEDDVLKSKKIKLTNFSDYIKNKIHGTNNIVKSINGIEADVDGNIELTSIQTITDNISYTQIDGNLPISKIENLQTELDSKISSVTITPTLKTGTEIATIEVDGEQTTLYIPKQITSLKDLAFKDKILSSDIENNLPISKIENLQTELNSKISSVIITSKLQNGTEIATIEVNGESKTLYAPEGLNEPGIHDHDDKYALINHTHDDKYSSIEHTHDDRYLQLNSVNVTPNLTNGTEIATIEVNGESKTLYAPVGSDVRGGVVNVGIGSVIAFAGENIPDNTLLCDGREVSKTEYVALYSVIGDKYGQASDSSKFKLPNLNERFIEGINSDLSVGQYLESGLPNITGSIFNDYGWGGAVSGAFQNGTQASSGRIEATGTSTTTSINFDASKFHLIYGKSDTVQPSAVLMKYVIVYKQLEGGLGGIIDGTINSQLAFPDWDGNKVSDITTTSKSTIGWTAINNGYLVITPSTTNGSSLVYINGVTVSEVKYASFSYVYNRWDGDTNTYIDKCYPSIIPVTVDDVLTFSNTDVISKVEFYPVKSNGTINSQLAFPDWDESKKINITENDWISDSNGWILFESIDSYDTKIMINGITVGRLGQYDLVGCGTEIIPITVGDRLTYSGDTINIIGTNFTLTFYPIKTISQEIPSNCVSYVIESGRFNSSDGTTHSNNSENDSWYRLYSDGWCEQGGVCNLIETSGSEDSKTITMRQSYSNTTYLILCTVTGTGQVGTTSYLNKTDKSFMVQFDDNIASNGSMQEVSWEAKGFTE